MIIESLKQNKEFQRIYSKGKSFVSPTLITYILPTKRHKVRLGITTSKKIGNAVLRNRARRLIREAFRYSFDQQQKSVGFDIVFVARARTTKVKMEQVKTIMQIHLQKAGCIIKEE